MTSEDGLLTFLTSIQCHSRREVMERKVIKAEARDKSSVRRGKASAFPTYGRVART